MSATTPPPDAGQPEERLHAAFVDTLGWFGVMSQRVIADRLIRDVSAVFALSLLVPFAPPREVTEAQWNPIETAPNISRVLVRYQCGAIEIARKWHKGNNVWEWRGDDGETDEARPDADTDPRVGWLPLPGDEWRFTAALNAPARVDDVLDKIRAGVIENNNDTVWISPIETLVDYIDALEGRHSSDDLSEMRDIRGGEVGEITRTPEEQAALERAMGDVGKP